jgi:acyl-coenzyme A thioesterase PaaI-like protein
MEEFVATGYVLRAGRKVAVTRMERHNNVQTGTGIYVVGQAG